MHALLAGLVDMRARAPYEFGGRSPTIYTRRGCTPPRLEGMARVMNRIDKADRQFDLALDALQKLSETPWARRSDGEARHWLRVIADRLKKGRELLHATDEPSSREANLDSVNEMVANSPYFPQYARRGFMQRE